MLTEKEAKQKSCPIYGLLGGIIAVAASNGAKVTGGQEVGRCIASDCMAWRWGNNQNPQQQSREPISPADLPMPSGFCGLAGKP